MKQFSIDEIHTTLGTFEATDADLRRIADHLRDNITEERAAELLLDIWKETEENASPIDKEAMKKWKFSDRLLWSTREAFVRGFVKGTATSCEAARLSLSELEKAAVTPENR